MISRYSLEVIKILYRHRDFVLRGEEQAVADLASVLGVGRLGRGVVVVVLQSGLHLCLVKTGNNFVDDVLKRLVSPVTNKLSWNLLKHNNLFMLLKISECHSMNCKPRLTRQTLNSKQQHCSGNVICMEMLLKAIC